MDNFYIGSILPGGWFYDTMDAFLCDGRALSIPNNQALFAVINGNYGANLSANTFNIPDLRGKALLGVNTGGTPTLPPYAMGATGGSATQAVTLTTATMPAHTHSAQTTITSAYMQASSKPATLPAPGAIAFPAAMSDTGGSPLSAYAPANGVQVPVAIAAKGQPTVTINSEGTGTPINFNTLPPYCAVPYYIVYEGVYPVRD